jgi:hypothetical protein
MMAVVSTAAARLGESAFGRWCGKLGGFIDCTIPIVLIIVLTIGLVSVMFGFVH